MTNAEKNMSKAAGRILEGLNSKQVEAVTHTEGPLLILAGAGSGKTTVLTRRVAYLISQGCSPGSILAITFTNKAAGELRTRIQSMLGEDSYGLWAATFHSVCARILRAEFKEIGRSSRFSIFDGQDQTKTMKACLKELDLSEKQYSPGGLLRTISNAKNNLLDPGGYRLQAGTFYEAKVAQAYGVYQQKLSEMDALDFDDLLMQTVVMFREHADILAKYRRRFQNILVDEYQDTNGVQYELTRLLAAEHKRIAVVGDDDQSIYTFRGADIRNILEFEKDYPSCKVVKLEQNYRSTQVILDGAFNVVRHNVARKEKKLWTSLEGGLPITLYAGQSGSDEARFVVSEIEELAAQGIPLSSFAILYRTHAQSRAFEEEFVRRGIPYSVLSGYRFYERKHIKDAISYLRVLAYPKDIISLERIIDRPPRGLGPAALRKIRAYALRNDLGLMEAMAEADSIKGLNRSQAQSAGDFGAFLLRMWEMSSTEPLPNLLHGLLEGSGYIEALERQGTADSDSRLLDLEELMASMKPWEGKEDALFEYLETCSLVSDQDTYNPEFEAPIMGTLHSAKGLEFEVVFLVGVEEGTLPHARSALDEFQLEEERRLLYVGMTRAKRLLYLTLAFARETYRGPIRTAMSRFIKEIPAELLEIKTREE